MVNGETLLNFEGSKLGNKYNIKILNSHSIKTCKHINNKQLKKKLLSD